MDAPIAERVFFLEGKETEPVVIFRIWKPNQPENDYPRCRWELVVGHNVSQGEVSGVDALDSIIMCFSKTGTEIAGLNESVFGGKLRWIASPEGGRGLGLPTIEDHWPFRDLYRSSLIDRPE